MERQKNFGCPKGKAQMGHLDPRRAPAQGYKKRITETHIHL